MKISTLLSCTLWKRCCTA